MSMQVHAGHCSLLGQDIHWAASAAVAVAPILGTDARNTALSIHKKANLAKHNHLSRVDLQPLNAYRSKALDKEPISEPRCISIFDAVGPYTRDVAAPFQYTPEYKPFTGTAWNINATPFVPTVSSNEHTFYSSGDKCLEVSTACHIGGVHSELCAPMPTDPVVKNMIIIEDRWTRANHKADPDLSLENKDKWKRCQTEEYATVLMGAALTLMVAILCCPSAAYNLV